MQSFIVGQPGVKAAGDIRRDAKNLTPESALRPFVLILEKEKGRKGEHCALGTQVQTINGALMR